MFITVTRHGDVAGDIVRLYPGFRTTSALPARRGGIRHVHGVLFVRRRLFSQHPVHRAVRAGNQDENTGRDIRTNRRQTQEEQRLRSGCYTNVNFSNCRIKV